MESGVVKDERTADDAGDAAYQKSKDCLRQVERSARNGCPGIRVEQLSYLHY